MATVPAPSFTSNPKIDDLACRLSTVIEAELSTVASFEAYENAALALSNEVVRRSLESRLQNIADGQQGALLVDGDLCHSHEEGTVAYHSLCGDLRVTRCTYRLVGQRSGAAVVPVELTAGLIEGATPALAYSVALGYARHDSRQYAEDVKAAHRVVPSRSTLERMGKAIGLAADIATPTIERYVRQSEGLPEGAASISVGLDRTTVPMVEDRPSEEPPKTRRKKRTKPRVRKMPDPVDVNWRHAYVGTFSVVDHHGDVLSSRYYTALASEDANDITKRIMADIRASRRQDVTLPIGITQDGAPELWRVMCEALKAEPTIHTWHEIIDRYHLNERLGTALRIIEPDEHKRDERLSSWNDQLDSDDASIDRIERWLKRQYSNLDSSEAQEKLWEHLVYISNNKGRMRYASMRAMGLLIGSGVTEGACKSVIGNRTSGSGQRWREPGLKAALTLRAIHHSDRLPGFWRLFGRRYTGTVEKAAA